MTVKDIDFNRIYKDDCDWYFIPETKNNLHRVKWLYCDELDDGYSAWEDYTDSNWVKTWIPTEFTKDEIAEFRLWVSL